MRQDCKVYLISDSGEKFFGIGPAELLERVAEEGSLSHAAKEMGMSYSKALKLIHTAERALGMALLTTEAGGVNGGKSQLTPEAYRFLKCFRDYEGAVRHAAESCFQRCFQEVTKAQ